MVLLACAVLAVSTPGAEPVPVASTAAPQIVAQPVATSPLVPADAPAVGNAGNGPASPALLPTAAAPATPASTTPASTTPASTPPAESPGAGLSPTITPAADIVQPRDPWEKTNRSIFAFDNSVDRHLVGPVARGYAAVLPFVVRHHISLVIANLDEPITIGNNLLQLRMAAFGKSLARFTLNSTIGLAGIFDFASHHKLEHHTADFGQTLGRWGAKPGPFVMLPLLGPANLRDGIGRAVDLFGDPVSWVLGGITSTFGGTRVVVEVVDVRVQAEPALRAVNDSTDPYAATRSGYTQARAAAVREATGKTEDLPDFDAPTGKGS